MKAVLCKQYGPPDSLAIEEVESPRPGANEVVVSMKAASLNFPDVLIIQNKYQFKPPLPFSPGSELAGVVKEVGPGVERFKPGDRVMAFTTYGAFAEEVKTESARLLPLPEGMDFASGASFILTYGTTDHALRDRARLQPGETLLVLGAAGGVLEEVLDLGAALSCAEAVGALKFSCDTTLEYLKTRKQFGVPIGAFQALQHRMVDMFISYEQARSMACLACSKVDQAESAQDRARSVSAAKIRIADAARHVSQEAVQLHGGMGMTEELKVSHAFRRLTALTRRFGDVDQHLERFASL